MKNMTTVLLTFLFIILFSACQPDFEIIEDMKYADYQLVNQDSANLVFPKLFKGKIGVVGYIFTNCPDICPITTNNMRLVQEKLKSQDIADVEFVSISFDPEIDTPEVLKGFAEIRDLDLSNWEFLTGDTTVIKNLMKQVGVVAIANTPTVSDDGTTNIYYTHTDRIQLFDQDGRIRKNYLGSQINIDEIVSDIKKLK